MAPRRGHVEDHRTACRRRAACSVRRTAESGRMRQARMGVHLRSRREMWTHSAPLFSLSLLHLSPPMAVIPPPHSRTEKLRRGWKVRWRCTWRVFYCLCGCGDTREAYLESVLLPMCWWQGIIMHSSKRILESIKRFIL